MANTAVADALGRLGSSFREIARDDIARKQTLAKQGLDTKKLELMGQKITQEGELAVAAQEKINFDNKIRTGFEAAEATLTGTALEQAKGLLSQIDPVTGKKYGEMPTTVSKFVDANAKIRSNIAEKQAADAKLQQDNRDFKLKEDKLKQDKQIADEKNALALELASAKTAEAKDKIDLSIREKLAKNYSDVLAGGDLTGSLTKKDGTTMSMREYVDTHFEDIKRSAGAAVDTEAADGAAKAGYMIPTQADFKELHRDYDNAAAEFQEAFGYVPARENIMLDEAPKPAATEEPATPAEKKPAKPREQLESVNEFSDAKSSPSPYNVTVARVKEIVTPEIESAVKTLSKIQNLTPKKVMREVNKIIAKLPDRQPRITMEEAKELMWQLVPEEWDRFRGMNPKKWRASRG